MTRAHLAAADAQENLLEASPAATVPLPALELPAARRPGWPTLAALAIGCGVVAVVLGAIALVAGTGSEEPAAAAPALESLAVLTDPRAEWYPLRGSLGRISLVVNGEDAAVLVIAGLGAAPDGMTYAAWVIPPGSAEPVAAGTFDATERAVPLATAVLPGARVGVTLEPAGGSDRPSRPLRLVAVRIGA